MVDMSNSNDPVFFVSSTIKTSLTLIRDFEKNHGKGKVSFTQQRSAVMIAIKTNNLGELVEIYKQMGFTVAEQRKNENS